MMEFESLIDAARTASAPIASLPADVHELDRKIACPHCHRPMEAHFYAGSGNVVMDSCEPCCLHWLDHDELARIAQANPTEPNPIDSAPDAFYNPAPDREDDPSSFYESDRDLEREAGPASEVIDLLSRVLKPRM
jgi:Zn-finger nucleic acid-binding protein